MKWLLLTLIIWLGPLGHLWAAPPVFDAQSNETMFDATSMGWDLVVGGGCANNIVIVSVGHYNATATTLTGVTVGGSAATQIATQADTESSSENRLTTFYRKGVGTGTKAIAVTFSGNNGVAVGSARSYCDVDQTTPLGTAASNHTNSSTATVDVTSTTGELVVDSSLIISLPTTATVGGGQTQQANFTDLTEANFRLVESDEAGANPTTMSWSLSEARYFISIGVPLKPVSAASGSRRVIIVQ